MQFVVGGQALSGDLAGALLTAKTLDPALSSRILISIAELQANHGDQAGSEKTLRGALEDATTCLTRPPQGKPGTLGANPEFMKSRALMDITTIEAKLSNFDAALETAREMPANPRGGALSAIAKEQARRGRAEEAWAWITKLKEPGERSFAIRGLADGIAADKKSGEPAPARR
jgi:hypothetical protein